MHRARLPIAQPCHERFEAMNRTGSTGSTERFCDKCSTPVHDLSQMTRVQAELFLAERSGQRVCVRYRSDGAGNLQFRPAPPIRPALVLAVASLALAACTGYVDSDSIESPDDALACEDESGYTIPCEDTTAAPPVEVITEPEPEPAGDDGVPGSVEGGVLGQVEVVEMGDVEVPAPEGEAVELLGQAVPDPGTAAEGCPVPRPDEGEVLMGDIVAPPSSRLKQQRLERQWKREQRRQARRDRRVGAP